VLINRRDFHQHWFWFSLFVLGTIGSTFWFFWLRYDTGAWPPGSSLAGLTFGLVGGGICLFELLLWFRKKVRTWRIGRVQAWMRAHIWLGLLSAPVLLYHSGFNWGNQLANVLMVLFVIVILSGIWGLILQNIIPRVMIDEVPAETIASQIPFVVGQLTREAERLVVATCGPDPDLPAQQAEQTEEVGAGFVVVGAVRTVGRVQGKVLETRTVAEPVPNSEFLRHCFLDVVKPYLEQGSASGSPLAEPARADAIFQDLRLRVAPGAHPAVDVIKGIVEQRRQLERQQRLNFWLHNWLVIHLPLSVALIVLMFVHVFVALKYLYVR
jgi:hypothetical protein